MSERTERAPEGGGALLVDDGWKDRDPRPLDDLPQVVPFPVHVFPDPVREFVTEGGESLGCWPDYFGLMALVAGGMAAGATWSVRLKEDYSESGLIWGVCVGAPGVRKTPAMKKVLAPVHAANRKLYDDGEKYVRLITTDVTGEALCKRLLARPRGVWAHRDELVGLLRSFDQYRGGKGGDRQFYLSAWSLEPHIVDRASTDDDPVLLPKPFVGLSGGMQPDVLTAWLKEQTTGDGFPDRILWAFPPDREAPRWNEQSIRMDITRGWCDRIVGLYGFTDEVVLSLSTEGSAAWREGFDAVSEEISDRSLSPFLVGAWTKMQAYAARFIVALRALSAPLGDAAAVRARVSADEVKAAWELVAYFQNGLRRLVGDLSTSALEQQQRKILEVLRARPKKPCGSRDWSLFTTRDISQKVRHSRKLFGREAPVIPALLALQKAGWIREVGTSGEKQVWECHPCLLS